MLAQEFIRQKRDGKELATADIGDFIAGLTQGSVSEGQAAAFAMAVFLRGMTRAEAVALTRAMRDSGTVLSWKGINRPIVDKHSTGGVGDNVSLMLAPMLAAAGAAVPMISGRGLGHTGGTLDKLASIPGYRTSPDISLFRRVVREVGCAIIGQTDDLAPADRRLYAIRDVTATVESIPLIAASILSKKLAAGLDGLVMDVKTGSGAFMSDPARARELAETIVTIAGGADLKASALITDMDQVLGRTAGNALEVAEAVDYLTGRGVREQRLHDLVLALAAEMLMLGGLAATPDEGRAKAQTHLDDGSAAEVFARMVTALGGPKDFITRADELLPRAAHVAPCPAPRAGVIAGMDTRRVGVAIIDLGGGRRHHGDAIDPAVGFTDVRAVGTPVAQGEPLAMVHAGSSGDAERAIAALQGAIRLADTAPAVGPVVRGRVAAPRVGGN
jgi:thymidine phosphorylase